MSLALKRFEEMNQVPEESQHFLQSGAAMTSGIK